MKDAPLVSIITPCYNMAHCVSRLFDSVVAQTYRPLEFILVNDGSTDDIDVLVKSYRPIFEKAVIDFIYWEQENRGLAGAINAGLMLMHGDYFIWPDADDYLEKDSVMKRVRILEARTDCGVVTGQAYLRDSQEITLYKRILRETDQDPDKKRQFERLLKGEALFCPGCHMIRTAFFLEVNPDRQIYPARRGQNWQLLLPMYYRYPRAYLDEPVYNYIDYPNSMSKDQDSIDAILYRYREHEKIIFHTLKKIEKFQGADLRCYIKWTRDCYAKLRMETAIRRHDANAFRLEYYRKWKTIGLDWRDRFAWLRMAYPIVASGVFKLNNAAFGRREENNKRRRK